jgi:hypothetical protein
LLFQPWPPLLPWPPCLEFPEPVDWTVTAVGWLLEAAEPVDPVLPELVQLEPLALPDLAPEAVTGLAEAEPVEPPLPEFPDVGAEFTVAGPVAPVDPVLPELPDCAEELGCPWCCWPPWLPIWVSGLMPPWTAYRSPDELGAKLMLAPVLPDFPEFPESPEDAQLRLLLAFPVLPELALPDLAVVSLEEEESALPLFPPVAEPLAVLAPELPDVAVGEPVAEDEPALPGNGC